MKKIEINDNFIQLGKFLKKVGFIQTGGECKFFLDNHEIKVNDIEEKRRGKKLKIGDMVEIDRNQTYLIYKKLPK